MPEGDAGDLSGATATLGFRFLIAFVRSLLSTLSSDQIIIAVGSAAGEVGIPRKVAETILPILLGYKKHNSIWPEGFMS